MIITKDSSVEIWNLHPGMQYALTIVDCAHNDLGIHEVVVTSGHESTATHKRGSAHRRCMAVDLRRWYLDDPIEMVAYLQEVLRPEYYDVILESDHIHLELDPK